jgi:hypothetical protein
MMCGLLIWRVSSFQEVYETENERVFLVERLVLTTMGFDLNIHHPYKPHKNWNWE